MSADTYSCSRCSGTGRLAQFSNVIGGTCFKCHGTGTQASKPAARAAKWAVFGHDRQTGECTRLYNISARTEAAAIEKARATMAGASTEWRNTYTLSNARAMRCSDMTDPTALTWEAATTKKESAI